VSLPLALGRTAALARRGGAAPVWTPLDDPGLVAWYDPSDPAARTLDGSDRFEALTPKGAGGKEAAVQATADARPTLTTLGGVEALGLDGNRWLRGAWAASLAQPCMSIVVCDITGTGATYVICDNEATSNHAIFFASSTWRASAPSVIASGDTSKNGIRAHAFVAAGGDSAYYIDDFTDPLIGGSAGSTGVTGRTIGGNISATPGGRVVGVIGDHIITTSTDATTRALYAQWLTDRYAGLTVDF
jgi:hypothetical protein